MVRSLTMGARSQLLAQKKRPCRAKHEQGLSDEEGFGGLGGLVSTFSTTNCNSRSWLSEKFCGSMQTATRRNPATRKKAPPERGLGEDQQHNCLGESETVFNMRL
jgi:hypothetical protein